MRYPVAIHHEENTSFGVTIPDIEGCFSAGDTFDEALNNAEEAIKAHLGYLSEEGIFAPSSTNIQDHQLNNDYDNAIWGFVDVDITRYSGKTEKINATLPTSILIKIEEEVKLGRVKSRSAFLTEATLNKLNAIR